MSSARYAKDWANLPILMTLLQLTDGKEIRVSQGYDDIRGLLQKAIAEGTWLELQRDDGTVVGINPANVSYIQNSTQEGVGPAHGENWHSKEHV